jgi:hypothetical protein
LFSLMEPSPQPLPDPGARHSDPDTSREAARQAKRSGRQHRHAAVVLDLVRRNPGSTSGELWEASNGQLERHEVSRRLADVCRAGLVRQGVARVCRVKGTKMVTWEAVG